jgi:hypothetical protein
MRRRRLGVTAAVVSLYVPVLIGAGLSTARSAGAAPSGPAVHLTAVPVGSSTFNGTLYSTTFDLSQVGYESSQYFLSGTARSFVPTGPLTTDGRWHVTTGVSAAYTTRLAVYRPVDPRQFNGTVLVEWLNVTGGVDAGPEWTLAHNELVREGFAWVGVSAQAVGVNNAKRTDPAEYGALSHPGDSFSYDIFSQAGAAVRADASTLLGGLAPRTVIAAGESQSAIRMMTYVDAVQPVAHVYDGFLVHSQFGTGAALSQAPQASYPAPKPTTVRSDLGVPVLEFETETDVSGSNLADRLFVGDPSEFRLWEVAGSSHYDYYGLVVGPTDTGNGEGAVENLSGMQFPPTSPGPLPSCALPINTGGTHWVLDAAIYWLNQWVVNGAPPPQPPYLGTTGSSPVAFARDASGNVVGGVRSPQVDVPIATLGGTGNSPAFCSLFGTTVAFSFSHVAALYPSHFQFVTRWEQAAQDDALHGYLVPADVTELDNAAAASWIW